MIGDQTDIFIRTGLQQLLENGIHGFGSSKEVENKQWI